MFHKVNTFNAYTYWSFFFFYHILKFSLVKSPNFQIYQIFFFSIFQSVKKNTFIPLVSIPFPSIFPFLIAVVLGWRSRKGDWRKINSKVYIFQMSSKLLKSSQRWGVGGDSQLMSYSLKKVSQQFSTRRICSEKSIQYLAHLSLEEITTYCLLLHLQLTHYKSHLLCLHSQLFYELALFTLCKLSVKQCKRKCLLKQFSMLLQEQFTQKQLFC